MADKEERILIARSSDYTLTDTDKGELFEGKIAPHCANVFTRQDAIERMKNAGLKYACRANGRDIPEEVHHHYANMMEAALNALLEEQK